MACSPTIQELHDRAVAAGKAGYLDPESGLFVLTATYLAERGHCCGSGCRHCPYPPEAWPPQKRGSRGA